MFKFNFDKFYNGILRGQYIQYLIVSLFFLFLIIGFLVIKDYGISTDEPFQRSIGYFYYISLIEQFFFNQELLFSLKNKFQNMYWSKEIINGGYIQYGVLFDLFAVSIEELLSIINYTAGLPRRGRSRIKACSWLTHGRYDRGEP